MVKGFYNLTSGMLSQTRRLDVIANNMTNVSTAGYKAEQYTDRTFDEVMAVRIGNKLKTPYQELPIYQAHILAPDHLYTDFQQGAPEETDLPLDFCIQGEGFFAIQMAGGTTAYTRAGSFTLDNEGYLCLSELGRVLDREGNPIQLPTDKLDPDLNGNLYTKGGQYLGTLGVFTFPDNGELERNPYGLFIGQGAQVNEDVVVRNKYVERSNVNLVKEMVSMMATQRTLQSAAQMSQIYDEIIKRAVNDIGRLA